MIEFDITDKSSFDKIQVVEALRQVMDPELNINIIDLGLVYDVVVNEGAATIKITMTLSSSHCPMGDAIIQSVKNCLEGRFEGFTIDVELTWTPVWTYESITEEGLQQLRSR